MLSKRVGLVETLVSWREPPKKWQPSTRLLSRVGEPERGHAEPAQREAAMDALRGSALARRTECDEERHEMLGAGMGAARMRLGKLYFGEAESAVDAATVCGKE